MLYSPGTIADDGAAPVTPAADPTTTPEPTDQTQVPTPAPVAQPAPVDAAAILAAINQDRERREAGIRAEAEAKTYKSRAEEAEAKLAAQEKAKKNRVLDPAGFLRKMGYTDRELALTAEGIMFSLVPDKAPADHRAKLVEAQMLRNEEAAEEAKLAEAAAAKTREADSLKEQNKQAEARYQGFLKEGVAKFQPGAFPATQAWFADDHDAYSRELLDTAQEVAAKAAPGSKLDLRPEALAPIVEKKFAERAKRWATFSQVTAPTQSQTRVQPAVTAKPAEITPPPVPRKFTDKELISRAAAAAFSRQ